MAHQSDSFLVPVVNSSASLRAVGIACMLAKPRKAKVYVVHVIEVARSLPLNAEMEADARRGEQLLRRAEDTAQANGYQVTGELLQAREAGQAIVDEARDRTIGMIILGVPYRPAVEGFSGGKTADFVLTHAESEVWVVRQGPHADAGNEE